MIYLFVCVVGLVLCIGIWCYCFDDVLIEVVDVVLVGCFEGVVV